MLRAAIVLVILGIVFIPLEKLRPVRRGQRVLRAGARTDVLRFMVTGTLGLIGYPLQQLTPDALRNAIAAQTAVVQFFEAILLVELCGYWAHRAHHQMPMLWKLHHVHHTGDADARDRNFAGRFPWVDRLFGTYHAPVHAWPGRYGVDEPMPPGYLRQLQSPFVHAPLVEAS